MSVATKRGRIKRLTDQFAFEALSLYVLIVSFIKRQMAGVATYGAVKFGRMEGRRRSRSIDPDANALIRAGQASDQLINVMLAIVIAAVIGYVGVKATAETDSSVDVESGSAFDNSTDALTSGFESAMSLTEVVFIVLMLGVIVTALVVLRGGRR